MNTFTTSLKLTWPRILIALIAFVLLTMTPATASAQTACGSPCVLTVGQSFTAVADHDGLNVTGYRVYLDNVKLGADLPVSQLVAGSVTVVSLVAPARGAHTLQFAAFNEDAESKSVAFPFTVKKAAPTAPSNLRVLVSITVAANGNVTFKVVGIEGSK